MALALLFSAWLATTTPVASAPPRPGDARVSRDHVDLACGLASVIGAVHAVPPPTRGTQAILDRGCASSTAP